MLGLMGMISTLKEIQFRIKRAATDDGRSSDDITLVAVSKRQSEERIELALEAGIRVFGENKVQEAKQHWESRRFEYSDLTLHLIGPLQTNKVADAVTLFDGIEVVDRDKLAGALSKEMQKQGVDRECFIQINTGKEEQKSGVYPQDAVAFSQHCKQNHGLNITGLMCIPPVFEEAAMHFALMKKLGAEAGLEKLSMGMSSDFEEAIRFGSTEVRLGSCLFGLREN